MLKVLAVDDTEANLKLLQLLLKKMGHEVLVARNGLEAVELYDSEKPDLILMDVMMGVMDGFEAAELILNREPDHWVPILFLSAAATEEYFYKGLDIGGHDYLFKPINQNLLRSKINSIEKILLRQKQLEKENERLVGIIKASNLEGVLNQE